MFLDSEKIKKHLIEFIRQEFTETEFHKGIVGLSGGVDSALVTYLAVEALGRDNVLALLMPYKTSSPDSIIDAREVVKILGIKSEIIDITPMVDAYIAIAGEISNIRKGNIMARQRMIVLYDISAREKALVIGTSNKTEILLGYGTLYGDTACAINPIGDLYKTQVWQLAEAVGVPQKIIKKQPTADLWSGQTDEGELGFSYREIDRLLYAMINLGESDEKLMSLRYDQKFINKVREMIRRNEFKRRPPRIAKIS